MTPHPFVQIFGFIFENWQEGCYFTQIKKKKLPKRGQQEKNPLFLFADLHALVFKCSFLRKQKYWKPRSIGKRQKTRKTNGA